MNKKLVVALVVVLVAAGVMVYARGGKDSQPQVKMSESVSADKVNLACANCRAAFTMAEAKPVQGNQRLVLCPKCGKPTPLVAAKAQPASK